MLDMTDSQTIRLRSATLKDVRDMAIIKLSNKSTFADLLSGMGDCSSSTDSAIKLQEFDIQGRLASQNALVMVATVQNADNDHELVAGWALWKVFDDPQPLEEKPPDRHVNGESERTVLSRACQADFKKALVSGRNAHTAGKCNIRLCNLFTHPSYHRRGIGGKLLQFGTDLADQKGYVSYLEASPMGKPLYERHGFKEIDSFTLDLDKYRVSKVGRPDLYTTSLMIRQPLRGNRTQ